MSSRKDKFLESAQKFIAKGQFDRAIKDYQEVVSMDPSDIRHRQRLAELFVKVNQKEDAITEYEAIGKHYANNAFFLKAIAVYKQIQKLNPDNVKTALMLGSLNAKQGLVGNAMSEFNTAFSYYEKNGKQEEALTVLEQMLAVDPENFNTQLRFAETHFAMRMIDKAYEEFTQLAHLLQKSGDESAFNGIVSRIQHLFPDKKDFLLDFLSSQVARGESLQAIPKLKELLAVDRQNLRAWALIAEAMRNSGDISGMFAAFRNMVVLSPDMAEPRLGLLQGAVATGEKESILNELREHAGPLIKQGKLPELEKVYDLLLNDAPDDIELLKGFKEIYSAAGDNIKLAAIQTRLDGLLQKTTVVEQVVTQVEPLQEKAKKQADISHKQKATPIQHPVEPEWEEEIDLSLIDAEEEPLPATVVEEAPLQEEVEEDVVVQPSLPPEEKYVFIEVETGPEVVALLFGGSEMPITADITEEIPFGEEIDLDMSEGLPSGNEIDLDMSDEPEEALDLTPEMADDLSSVAVQSPGISPDKEPMLGAENAAGPEGDELLFGEDDLLDFGAELFHDKTLHIEPEVATSGKSGLDGLPSEFKGALDQQVDREDTETHFDLGIAYKEMGLFDDAIAEFSKAAADPQRLADCLTLQGVCYQEKGDPARAESIFTDALAVEGLSREAMMNISYELAFLYEVAGRKDEAIDIYAMVCKEDPVFRDVAEKLAELRGEGVAAVLDEVEMVELVAEEVVEH